MRCWFLKTSRGQAVIMDFALAFFVFILAWVFLSTQFDNTYDETLTNNDLKIMKVKTDTALEYLVKSPGIPFNWENLTINDLNKPGLATSDRKISEAKLSAFSNLSTNYEEMKAKLELEEFDFYFSFIGEDNVNAGLDAGSNANEVILERVVEYKGGLGVAKLKVYKLE